MDQLEGMRLFTRVVETGSFSEAARKLDLEPSSVSRAIAALEDRLRVRLIQRTTRRLNLTEAGQLFYERAAAILQDVEAAHLALTDLEGRPRGTLRVSVPLAFGNMQGLPAVFEFLERYPEMRVDMTFTDHFVDLVQDGQDVAIRVGLMDSSSLMARKLVDNRRVVCASPAYLKRHGTPRTPQDLARHNCLVRNPNTGRGGEWRFTGAGGEESVTVSGTFHSNSAEALRQAALRGLGVICVSTWIVGEDLRSGAFRTVLDGFEARPSAADATIYAVYPHNRHLSPKVRAFIDHLAQAIRKPRAELRRARSNKRASPHPTKGGGKSRRKGD